MKVSNFCAKYENRVHVNQEKKLILAKYTFFSTKKTLTIENQLVFELLNRGQHKNAEEVKKSKVFYISLINITINQNK